MLVDFTYIPQVLRADMVTVLKLAKFYMSIHLTDSFTLTLADRQLEESAGKYFDNTDLLKNDVERLASKIIVQIINTLGRENEAQPIPGSIKIRGPRLFIQPTALRGLQALLLIMCIAALLFAFLLRPSSCLRENPTSIAATAIILSASDSGTEEFFAHHCVSSDDHVRNELSLTQCRLSHDQRPRIEMEIASSTISNSLPSAGQSQDHSNGQHSSGWQPLALRAWAKWGTIFVFCAVIAALAILQSLSTKHSGLGTNSSIAQAIFGYVTTIILLLLSYICSSIDASIRSLSSYNSLRDLSRRRSLLLKSKESLNFRVPFKATGVKTGLAVIASSIMLLLFPAIKIVAAGLFTDIQMVTTPINVSVDIDTSLVDNLDYLSYIHNPRIPGERASQFVEWIITPSIGIEQRAGIVDKFVLSNIVQLDNQVGNKSFSGSKLHARVPAVAVDVRCTSIPEDDFEITARSNHKCKTPLFDFKCASDHCRDILSLSDLELTNLVYLAEEDSDLACPPQPFTGAHYLPVYPDRYPMPENPGPEVLDLLPNDLTWKIILADFTPILSHVPVTATNETTESIRDASSIDAGIPTLRLASCERHLSLVEIDASFTQPETSILDQDWIPSDVDHQSVSYIRQYNTSTLGINLWYMPWGDDDYFDMSFNVSFSFGGLLNDTTLWPSYGGSSNPFQLLAAFAEYKHHNLTSLLNSDQFARINEEMYTAFVAQMLTDMRSFASDLVNSSSPSRKTAQGTILASHARIGQDLRTTIIIEVLLALALICVLWIFSRFTGDAILPKEPDSIAARLSLLAGSRLVERLRREGFDSTRETDIWEEPSSLGWWKVTDTSNAANGSRRWRWGIDVGTDAHLSGWDKPPKDTDKLKDVSTGDNISPGPSGDGPQGMHTGNSDGVIEPLLPFVEDISGGVQDSDMQWSDGGIPLRRITL